MDKKLAYLIGGKSDPSKLERIRAREHPRIEYDEIVSRHGADLLDFDTAAGHGGMARFFWSRRQPYFALAAAALARRREFRGFLTSGEDVGLPLALLSRASGSAAPIYVITHGSYFASSRFRRLMGLLRGMRNLHFLTLSATIGESLVSDFGVSPERIHNTSYGTDTDFFHPVSSSPEPGVIVSAGAANRDYRTLVQAITPLPVHLRIAAGSAWFPAPLDVTEEELPRHVDVRSYGYPELKRLYGTAQFVVVPLYPGKHACGYSAIAEALAMGKAVIATRTECYSDFIVEGETGFHVEPGDVAGLRARIVELIENPERARRMGQQAREQMEQLFSVDLYCRRIAHVAGCSEPPVPMVTPNPLRPELASAAGIAA